MFNLQSNDLISQMPSYTHGLNGWNIGSKDNFIE